MAMGIEHELNIEEGFLMTLQTFFEIKEINDQQKNHNHPYLSKIRNPFFLLGISHYF